MTVHADKTYLRTSIAEVLAKKTPADFRIAGFKAAELFSSWLSGMPKKEIKTIALFRSMKDEIDTSYIEKLARDIGYNVYFPPKKLKNSLENGVFENHLGAHSLAKDMDLIVVPGRAFDRCGRRLGRGGGHYDQCLSPLSLLKKSPILVGMGLEEQIVEIVPYEAHDVAMDFILTPQELFKASERI